MNKCKQQDGTSERPKECRDESERNVENTFYNLRKEAK